MIPVAPAAPLVDFSLYLITDQGATKGRELLTVVEEALAGGVRGVQLREKGLSPRDACELAQELRLLTSRYGSRLLINDRVDIALAVGADGVHLPESALPVVVARELLGPSRLIGVSCHSPKGALEAQRQGADFVTLGPLYATPSKARYGAPLGIPPLVEALGSLSIPLFALGGITLERLPELQAAGLHRIALISAILSARAPKAEADTFIRLLQRSAPSS